MHAALFKKNTVDRDIHTEIELGKQKAKKPVNHTKFMICVYHYWRTSYGAFQQVPFNCKVV